MDLWTAYATIGAAIIAATVAAWKAADRLRRWQDDASPETQDDFRASIERWGHLSDRRRGTE